MATGRKFGVGVGAALVVVAAWQLGIRPQREEPRPASAALNQMWIERMPRDTRDMVRQFVAFKTPRRQLGLAEATSHWRVFADRFTWKLDGSTLEASFPQVNRTIDFEIKTWRCKGTAPPPFDLCLELTFGGQTLAMFSREEWRVDPEGRVEGNFPVSTTGFAAASLTATDAEHAGYPRSIKVPEAWRLAQPNF